MYGSMVSKSTYSGESSDSSWKPMASATTNADSTGRDRIRDQAHTAAGMTPLRFTGAQVAFEVGQVRRVLKKVARRLMAERGLIAE